MPAAAPGPSLLPPSPGAARCRAPHRSHRRPQPLGPAPRARPTAPSPPRRPERAGPGRTSKGLLGAPKGPGPCWAMSRAPGPPPQQNQQPPLPPCPPLIGCRASDVNSPAHRAGEPPQRPGYAHAPAGPPHGVHVMRPRHCMLGGASAPPAPSLALGGGACRARGRSRGARLELWSPERSRRGPACAAILLVVGPSRGRSMSSPTPGAEQTH